MIPLFYTQSGIQFSIRHSARISNLRDLFNMELERVGNYHKDSSRSVNNSDIIVRFIKSMNVDTRLSMFDYVKMVDSRVVYIERSAGIISNTSFGKVLNILNGDGIILSIDTGIDHTRIKDNWKTIAPLKPFATENTDVSLPHPTKMYPTFTGYTIDSKLLMMMWYWYSKEVENPQVAYFVYRYLYTNMIPYYLDHAIVNLFLGKEEVEFKNTNPIYVLNLMPKLKRYLEPLIRKTKNKKLFYEEVMLNLKLIHCRDMLELYTIKATFFTKQSRHGMFILYKDILQDLIFYLGDRGMRRNLSVLKDVYIFLERMKSRKDLTSIDYDIYKEDIEMSLETLLTISKNRRI